MVFLPKNVVKPICCSVVKNMEFINATTNIITVIIPIRKSRTLFTFFTLALELPSIKKASFQKTKTTLAKTHNKKITIIPAIFSPF